MVVVYLEVNLHTCIYVPQCFCYDSPCTNYNLTIKKIKLLQPFTVGARYLIPQQVIELKFI